MTRASSCRVLAAVVLLAVAAACGGNGGESHDASGSPTKPAFAAKEATSTIDVTLQDYAFVGLPATTKGPNVLFKAKVTGGNMHELRVLKSDGTVVGDIPPFDSGTRTLAVTLAPGTYVVDCPVKEGVKTHADLGMRAELTVE